MFSGCAEQITDQIPGKVSNRAKFPWQNQIIAGADHAIRIFLLIYSYWGLQCDPRPIEWTGGTWIDIVELKTAIRIIWRSWRPDKMREERCKISKIVRYAIRFFDRRSSFYGEKILRFQRRVSLDYEQYISLLLLHVYCSSQRSNIDDRHEKCSGDDISHASYNHPQCTRLHRHVIHIVLWILRSVHSREYDNHGSLCLQMTTWTWIVWSSRGDRTLDGGLAVGILSAF